MVLIPAGSFWMGCAPGDSQCRADEKPRHRVTLDAYFIDRHEVTIRDHALCVRAGRCAEPADTVPVPRGPDVPCDWKVPGRELHPASCLDEWSAARYCEWRGKRLPTEAQWERAARGSDDRRFPWGDGQPDLATCWARTGSCPVGSDPAGASPFGVLDMAGNVAEWVSDQYHGGYYAQSPARNPRGPLRPVPFEHQICQGTCSTARGGHWASAEGDLRSTARSHRAGGFLDIGFRCARSAAPPAPAAR